MTMRKWFKSGTPWVWLTAAAVSASIIVVVGLLALIAARGLGHFWAKEVVDIRYQEPGGEPVRLIGEIHATEDVPAERLREAGIPLETKDKLITRYLVKIGNRDVGGSDFRWIIEPGIQSRTVPKEVIVIERREWGNFYGFLKEIRQDGQPVPGTDPLRELDARLERTQKLLDQIKAIEKDRIGAINYGLERLRLQERKLELKHDTDPVKRAEIEEERRVLHAEYETLQEQLAKLHAQINRDSLTAETSTGDTVEVPLSKVVDIYRPNTMSLLDKTGFYFVKLWTFLSEEPREANTEGGIFPAIFGTIVLVIIMSILVTPFGVIAAVYLREYAKQGPLTRVIRIAVNNLAGVPAIVYGVFGLGFFVYFLGGSIDQLFFPEALPHPTFGTPGLLWSSVTLALLTVPVVIVATEEGLARIPRSIREGSLALGATKAETLWRTVLPMASPAMMTGLILAVARAAGEVAPLMLVGVVKLAPTLPVNMNPPFVHLDQKFMHLGFHIYDVGFQSPNVDAARPLVYATALLLVLVIVVLNLTAITLRNRLREKYRTLES